VELSDLRTERRIEVRCPPGALYDLVTDVTNMGQWSPVCRACWWDEGAGPAVGSWFTGRNERDGRVWEARCEVVTAEPGSEFAWMVGGTETGTVWWSYRFAPTEGGTEVTECWRVVRLHPLMGETPEALAEMKARTEAGMDETLAQLRRTAEGRPAG